MIWPNKPQLHLHGFSSGRTSFGSKDRRDSKTNEDDHSKVQERKSINNEPRRPISDSNGSKIAMRSSKQVQINEGLKQLNLTVDILRDQQKVFSDEVKNQDEHLVDLSTA